MNRKEFLKHGALAATAMIVGKDLLASNRHMNTSANVYKSLAITMWDFSWLERRWDGGSYEDWDRVLDELVKRGYNAVRIDAYPHLVANGAKSSWTLLPIWDINDWGAPGKITVAVQPSLNQFIAKCKQRKIKVGLSSWFREDIDNTRMKITSAQIMGEYWVKTIDSIAEADLLDTILYVDACNEWPGAFWAPFFKNDNPEQSWGYWFTDKSMQWMREVVTIIRQAYPQLPVFFSMDNNRVELYNEKNLSFFDAIEHHIWMVKQNDNEFYKAMEYGGDLFTNKNYRILQDKAETLYNSKPQYWNNLLTSQIRKLAEKADVHKLPLVTTECWGIVDYKNWPALPWNWVKELCTIGTETACDTGQWIAIATSNFCGPQFKGMWKDISWHQQLTKRIKSSVIKPHLITEKWRKRI
jgi:hypothetical protein